FRALADVIDSKTLKIGMPSDQVPETVQDKKKQADIRIEYSLSKNFSDIKGVVSDNCYEVYVMAKDIYDAAIVECFMRLEPSTIQANFADSIAFFAWRPTPGITK